MNYSNNPEEVRVDFFKESGKWCATEVLKFDSYYSKDEIITDTFKRCLKEQFPNNYRDMIAVCLDPYHEHAHPLMTTH
jgi:hypothetical protein